MRILLLVVLIITFFSTVIYTQNTTKCGEGIGECEFFECCNKKGYGGQTEDDCLVSKGCQVKYGTCLEFTDGNDEDNKEDTGKSKEPANKGNNTNPGGVKMTRYDNEKTIWDFLYKNFKSKYAAGGVMGNFYYLCKLKPYHLQTKFEEELEMDSKTYTKYVDKGKYKNFATDKAGYGLARWKTKESKKALLDYAKVQGKSIGDLEMQLNFFWKDISSSKYSKIFNKIKKATSVKEVSDAIYKTYLNNKGNNNSTLTNIANYGRFYFNIY